MGVSRSAFTACSAARLEPLLSMVIVSYTILSDRLFKEAPRCHLVALGSEQEINGFARLVHRPVEILPLAFDFDIRFVHPPALAYGPLVLTERLLEQRHQLDHPTMHRGMINLNTALGHHFFEITQTQ